MPLLGIDTTPYGPGDGQSNPNITLPGSGFAVPVGIEAVFEYNGLFLNIRKNTDRYKIASIDGLGDADIRDTRDVNTDDDGETPFESFLGGRTIVLNGSIETYSVPKMRDMQMALRAAFNDVSQERPLHFRTGSFLKDHIIMCKKIAPLTMEEQQTSFKASRDFQITLRASNPRFLSYYQKFFSQDLPGMNTGDIELVTLINSGNYWAEPVFRIYGPSHSMQIWSDTTGFGFTVTNVPFGSYFDYDMSNGTLKDAVGGNEYGNLTDDSRRIRLEGKSGDNPSGSNVIFYNGDSPRLEISWRDSWI